MLRIDARGVDGIDDLRHLVHGSTVDLVQIEAGPLKGTLTHVASPDFALSVGSFSHGVRGRGVLSRDRVIVGIALSSTGPISQWSYECEPDDLTICPPGSDHESSYRGPITLFTLSMTPDDLAFHFANEGPVGDQAYWHKIALMPVDRDLATDIRLALSRIVHTLQAAQQRASLPSADYVRRSAVEAFGSALLARADEGRQPASTAANVVRRAEDFMARAGARAVHVSELCSSLGVSRRTLHRAFSEKLGIGPIAFLRQRRLTSVYLALRGGDPRTTRVGDVASEHGFVELGRFAAYYKSLFGEYPTDTLRRPSRGTLVQAARVVTTG